MKMKKKALYSKPQMFIAMTLTVSYVISNIVTVLSLDFFGSLTITAGELIFPVVYMLSDISSEVYGYKFSRRTAWYAIAFNIFAVVFFQVVGAVASGSNGVLPEQFNNVFASTPRILLASIVALFFGDWLNDYVFEKMRRKNSSHEGFKYRAIASSVAGQFIDSLVWTPIAFAGIMPIKDMWLMSFGIAIAKVIYEVVFMPFTSWVVIKIKEYEGVEI